MFVKLGNVSVALGAAVSLLNPAKKSAGLIEEGIFSSVALSYTGFWALNSKPVAITVIWI